MLILFVIALIVLSTTALWIWAVVDIVRHENLEPNARIIWIIVVMVFPFVGSIVYLVAGRNQGRRVA